REEFRRAEERQRDETRLARLRARCASLEKKLRKGYDQLLFLSDRLRPGAEERLEEVKREHEAAREEVRRGGGEAPRAGPGEGESPVRDLEETIAAAEAKLWRLREAAGEADSHALRQALREFVKKVEFRFAYTPGPAGRAMSQVTGGAIHLQDDVRYDVPPVT